MFDKNKLKNKEKTKPTLVKIETQDEVSYIKPNQIESIFTHNLYDYGVGVRTKSGAEFFIKGPYKTKEEAIAQANKFAKQYFNIIELYEL